MFLCIFFCLLFASNGDSAEFKGYFLFAGSNSSWSSVTKYGFQEWGMVQIGFHCVPYKGQQCEPWRQGDWPRLEAPAEDPVFRNGGLPQASDANLTLHLEQLRLQVEKYIPDPNFDGLGGLDWERYAPIWEENTHSSSIYFHWIGYQTYSEKLARDTYPGVNESQVVALAKRDFERGAQIFFQETLKTLRVILPKTRWGYYGLPYNFDDGLWYPAKAATAYAEAQRKIGELSGALFPSVYLSDRLSTNLEYINATIASARVMGGSETPIYAFVKPQYSELREYMSSSELTAVLTQIRESGAAGFVLWDQVQLVEGLRLNGTEISFQNYLEQVLGPTVAHFLDNLMSSTETEMGGIN